MKAILGSVQKDWIYIIMSFLSGFLILGLYFFLIDGLELGTFPAVLILVVIYSVLFDINHYFSTYFRVFLDKEYFKQNKKWVIPGLLFVTIGPMLALWSVTTTNYSYESYLFFLFFRHFVLILGLYHLIKQNWGFMAIYKGIEKEKRTKYNWNEWALISGGLIPLVILSINQPIWFSNDAYLFQPHPSQIDFVVQFWHKIVYLNFICAIIFGIIAMTTKHFQYTLPARNMTFYCVGVGLLILAILKWDYQIVLYVILGFLSLFFVVSLMKSIQLQRKEKSINVKKWAVFITSLILYFGIILFPIGEGNYGIIVVAITLPHNIQYLAFVPSFSKKMYEKSNKDHGIARKLSKHVVALFFVGVLFALFFEFGRSGSMYLLPDTQSWTAIRMTIGTFFLMLILHHYYLDAVIWKFGKDKGLKKGI